MYWKKILKKLYTFNLLQSLIIVLMVTLPWVMLLSRSPIDYDFAKTLAHYAAVYFSMAFLLYGFLYAISHLPKSRNRKVLVMFTRVYIRFHIATAIIGTVFIVLHAILMMTMIPIHTPIGFTGLLSMIGLLLVLITGYLRKRRSSGKRRRFHRYMAFLFIVLVIIHLII